MHDVYPVAKKPSGEVIGHRAIVLTDGGGFLEVMLWPDVLNGPEAKALEGEAVEIDAKVSARAGSSGGAFLNVTATRVTRVA